MKEIRRLRNELNELEKVKNEKKKLKEEKTKVEETLEQRNETITELKGIHFEFCFDFFFKFDHFRNHKISGI